ncbi:MAG TPA: ABC transporter permease subunit [Ilumatobacteraceae bacterium]|nr:ABC transporter permease subunit [Ilumatobacteraceae bacterium]
MTDLIIHAEGGRTDGAPPSARPSARRRRSFAFLGLLPFFGFLVLFLFIPAIGVFIDALRTEDGGWTLSAMGEAFSGQNFNAFEYSVKFSAIAALVGVFFGTLLAYAAATVRRPRWLRNLIASFSGVAANMGGLPLAFAFITLLGARAGVFTNILKFFDIDIYDKGFDLGNTWGLVTVYAYFNIPLMVLITLPAIDGLKASWREACANLGGTTFTYWRRVGLPVLAPSLLGGFLLLFANSFAAYATARILTDNSMIVSLRIGFFLGGDVSIGEDAVGYALAAWMIIIMVISMSLYWVVRKRAERWRS